MLEIGDLEELDRLRARQRAMLSVLLDSLPELAGDIDLSELDGGADPRAVELGFRRWAQDLVRGPQGHPAGSGSGVPGLYDDDPVLGIARQLTHVLVWADLVAPDGYRDAQLPRARP